MKRIVTIFCGVLLVLIIVYTLFSSDYNTSISASDTHTGFMIIANYSTGKVIYNEKTKVMYWVSEGYNNRGTLTLLVNSDGTPMIYEGE